MYTFCITIYCRFSISHIFSLSLPVHLNYIVPFECFSILVVHMTPHALYTTSPFSLSPQLSSLLSPGAYGDPLPPLVPEDRVVFGVSASQPATKTVADLNKTYSSVDTSTIAREVHVYVYVV